MWPLDVALHAYRSLVGLGLDSPDPWAADTQKPVFRPRNESELHGFVGSSDCMG